MREYWSDSDLFLKLDAGEREVYIGLWMLADDAGWMPRDIPAIAAAMYRYVDRAPREEYLAAVLVRLREMGKVESFRCCIHLPAVERYPRSGKKTTEHLNEHQTHSNGDKRIRTDTNPSPVPSLPDPSLPVVAPAPARVGGAAAGDPPRSLKDRVGWVPAKEGIA